MPGAMPTNFDADGAYQPVNDAAVNGHAWRIVFLRWHARRELFDTRSISPPMGLICIVAEHDTAGVSFATSSGNVRSLRSVVDVEPATNLRTAVSNTADNAFPQVLPAPTALLILPPMLSQHMGHTT